MIKKYCNFCLQAGEIQNPSYQYKNEYAFLDSPSKINTLGTVTVDFLDCNGNNVHYCQKHHDFVIIKALEEALKAFKDNVKDEVENVK